MYWLSATWLKAWKRLSYTNMLLYNLFTAIFIMPLSVISLASSWWIFDVTVKQKIITWNFAAYGIVSCWSDNQTALPLPLFMFSFSPISLYFTWQLLSQYKVLTSHHKQEMYHSILPQKGNESLYYNHKQYSKQTVS